MRWWFCIPGALVPSEVARHAIKTLPDDSARLLDRARVEQAAPVPESSAPHLDWLWQGFGGVGAPVMAPYLWSMLSGDPAPDNATLWCCEPVHFALARDHMLVNSLDNEAAPGDMAALMRVASTAAAGEGAAIVERQGAWFLRTDRAWQLDTTTLDGALGRSLTECWPEGADARRWRRLLTEVQVEWHHHAINERRAELGLPQINGLWLHGGGARVPLSNRAFASVVCDDPRLNAWAHAAGMPHERRFANDATPPADGDAVTLITDLLPAFNASDWGAWMLRWNALASTFAEQAARVHAAGFDLTLQLSGATHARAITIAATDRWRFWRGASRSRAAELLTDNA